MNALIWLISRTVRFLFGGGNQQGTSSVAREKEADGYDSATVGRARDFEADYHAATQILKMRMDKRFPDNYHARRNTETATPYDHGEDRAAAIDTMSAAIAVALRDGATVHQAANAGAASVGI